MNKETIDAENAIIDNHLNGTIPAAPGQKSLWLLVKEAASVLLVHQDDLLDVSDDRRRSTENRYLVFLLMEKAGYTHQQIATHFKMNRENVTKAITKIESWVSLYEDTRGTYHRLASRIL